MRQHLSGWQRACRGESTFAVDGMTIDLPVSVKGCLMLQAENLMRSTLLGDGRDVWGVDPGA
jgi:hypothetical protein